MTGKICRKCLIEDMDKDEFFKELSLYIKNYPKEKRICEEVYKHRLEICKECVELINGMCRKCGCYVELRALKQKTFCPSVPSKW